ncbi:nucleotidyltransferase/DNA polymerase involved in DNA repair (plasmid) [Thermobacillus composti KWC4]|jgi:DNA polymerase V|uniref:Nucleotidyltransferase/DNA polymerase involved in DNA repair n=1 Tax=Thermobacillus composti (strain DSM 18247 / JCM 13945 / KWC4) TaxID=717605 RepID=L0EK45_THECK|nr:nucleotidyltransferase/DNA polymerase [Thermobacillus composti]AGA60064.1 nucleotidyltransferase/DNA polymerase involved in DNA repair [Thermobacillus composti KWC4]
MDIDLSKLPRHDIFCIDFKSYYASVECVLRGLDPLTTYLVVVGDLSRRGSVVLAASPPMKRDYGIKTGSRLYEIPQHPKIHVVEARMNTYLDFSMQALRILKRYGPIECISVYSVDEVFFTYDSHRLFGDKWTAARSIQKTIKRELGLPVAIGIGNNYFQSKSCLDCLAKHSVETGFIEEVTYETFPQKMWHFPIRESWGIGRRMERKLNRLGIYTIGDLANANLSTMKARFGVIGEQLVLHARGIDCTHPYYKPVLNHHAIVQKGFGSGITLLRNYMGSDIITAILDQTEEVAQRAREAKMAGRTISLAIGYSSDVGGGGFSKSRTIETPTHLTRKIFQVCKELFFENYTGLPVRNIYVGLTNLSSDDVVQLDLFEDDTKARQLASTMDEIRKKYGKASLFWASSLTGGGTVKDRSGKIGGHKA